MKKRERENRPQWFPSHIKKVIILGTFCTMFGVLLAPLSNKTLDSEKHPRKTHGFEEKKRARIEKRPPPEKNLTKRTYPTLF
jgi:hypothetical protein